MSKIDINSINYIVTGNKEKIINVDGVDNHNNIIKNKSYILDVENDSAASYLENRSELDLDYNKHLIYDYVLSNALNISDLYNTKLFFNSYDDRIRSYILSSSVNDALSISFLSSNLEIYINSPIVKNKNDILSSTLGYVLNNNIILKDILIDIDNFAIKSKNKLFSLTVSEIIDRQLFLYEILKDDIYEYVTKTDHTLYSFSAGRNVHGLRNIGTNDVIRDLYDFKDVAIKSAIATRLIYSDSQKHAQKNVDIYLPHQKDDPFDFCQVKGYAYGLTRPVMTGPVLERTDILYKRLSGKKYHTNRPLYSSWLNPDEAGRPSLIKNYAPVYFYIPLDKLVDANGQKPKSYTEYLKSFGDISASMISTLYIPKYNYVQMMHNYIVEMPVDDRIKVEYNEYKKGIILGDIIGGKTMYDSTYCENANELGKFEHVRSYCGIGSCGAHAFLKYYDDTIVKAESINLNNLKTSLSSNVIDVEVTKPILYRVNHQKVEVLQSINRFLSSSKHKSNLFSIKIHNLHLDTLKTTDEIKEKIKNDIENSIRNVTSYLAPAHTQLFHVEYADD